MWQLFNALGMLAVVALLGLHGGQARSLPEQTQWRSDLDGMACDTHDRGAHGASARSFVVPASAGPFANWTPPAEIEARVLVWLPPAEIASSQSAAIVDFMATASIARRAPSWAPPAEIVAKALGYRSTFVDRARVWQPPVEIAPAKAANHSVDPVVGFAVPASAELPASEWARPTEIAAKAPAIEHRSVFTGGRRDWQPPAEIAPTRVVDGVDDIVTGLAARASPSRPRSNWAPPAEIAKLLPMSLGSSIANGALLWRPPAEIAKSRIARQ